MYSTTKTGLRRTAWMAARARNAARRGGLITAVGLLAVVTTVLVLILVPRQVNRSVRARIAALPPVADTVMLLANLTGASDRLRNAEANLQTLRVAYTDRVASATANAPAPSRSAPAAPGAVPFDPSDIRHELSLRVARARTAPLAENFRAVGDAEFLRTDVRARALLDSLNDISRDREAYAALSGPDARYAAMTARLTTLGQRLVMLAEQRLAASASASAGAAASAPAGASAGISDMAAPPAPATRTSTDSVRVSAQPLLDTTTLAQPRQFIGDSAAESGAREALDSAKAQLLSAERAMAAARATNARIDTLRAQAEAETPARVPEVAMLLAALITGLAVGYGAAFYREVKHPRIADAAEVERVADTRVIVHTGATPADRNARTRRESDEGLPRVIDQASEAYQLLHVTLTGFGDTSREVRVISSDALLGATVGINLAAAAVRDSRATLLIDATVPVGTARRLLLRQVAPAEVPAPRPVSGVVADANSGSGESGALIRTRVGRGLYLDTAIVPSVSALAAESWRELAHEHDFSVIVHPDTEAAMDGSPLGARDIVLCARVGVTRLDWLIARTEELRAHGNRLRAVLLWSASAPSAR